MTETSNYFGIENRFHKRHAETFTCKAFHIKHDPIKEHYELNIFDIDLCAKVKTLATLFPDTVRVIDGPPGYNAITVAYVDDSMMTIELRSPDALINVSGYDNYQDCSLPEPVVKVLADSLSYYSKLTDWAIHYPEIVRGNATPGHSRIFPGDDEFIIPLEMLNIKLNVNLPLGSCLGAAGSYTNNHGGNNNGSRCKGY